MIALLVTVVLLLFGSEAGAGCIGAPVTFWAYGDSKSGVPLAITPPPDNYVDVLASSIGFGVITPYKQGISGATAAILAARVVVDANELQNATFYNNVNFMLLTVGVNDAAALPAEATWKTNYAAILDAYHARWASGKVGIALPWGRSRGVACNTLATWITAVISTRSWATVVIDERVLIENGDDGATYTYDGIHPNAAGIAVVAVAWKTWMGY